MLLYDYEAIGFIWPNPVAANEQHIPFSEIKNFGYELHTETVRGAAHRQAVLFAFTERDTIPIGRTQYYHGEFGWITDWRSSDAIDAEAQAGAERAVDELLEVVLDI